MAKLTKSQIERKKREKYINKVKKEFSLKGYSLEGVNLDSAVNNKALYEKAKKKIQATRNAYKSIERHSEERKIKEKNRVDKLQEKLFVTLFGYNPREEKPKFSDLRIMGRIWDNKYKYGLSDNLIMKGKKETIKNRITDKTIKDFKDNLIDNYTYKVQNGVNKGEIRTVNSFFRNVSEETYVEEFLEKISKMMKEDKHAILNQSVLLNYLYNNILYEMYEADGSQYNRQDNQGRYNKQFWEEVGVKLERYYKGIIVR